jgi:hypothetical protein
MAPAQRVAVVILANRNGGILGRTERHVLEQLIPSLRGRPEESESTSAGRAGQPIASFDGTYVNGSDTLRFVQERDTLFYHYKTEAMPTRREGDAVLVLDRSGQAVQQFRLVRGTKSENLYLHDGLNAFRRVIGQPGPSRRRP